MTFSKYQQVAKTTAIYDSWHKKLQEKYSNNQEVLDDLELIFKALHISYTLMGLSGEVGEIMNKFKKVIRDSHGVLSDEKIADFSKELGDTMWYQSAFAEELNLDLDLVAEENLEKLLSRKDRGVLNGSGDNR